MTTITFFTENGSIRALDIVGHSGYADAGADIVCAAVTGALRLVECTLSDILGLALSTRVDEEKAAISLRLPNASSDLERECVQSLLAGLMLYYSSLHEEYPDHVTVFEEA